MARNDLTEEPGPSGQLSVQSSQPPGAQAPILRALTVEDIYRWMVNQSGLDPRRIGSTRSALRACCGALKVAQFSDIPAQLAPRLPAIVAKHLKDEGASRKRVNNYKWLVKSLVKAAKSAGLLSYEEIRLLPDWDIVLQRVPGLPKPAFKVTAFKKFGLWATAHSIRLADVDSDTTKRFFDWLHTEEAQVLKPREYYVHLRLAWRAAVSAGLLHPVTFYWPPDRRARYGIPFSEWPKTLRDDFEQYRAWATEPLDLDQGDLETESDAFAEWMESDLLRDSRRASKRATTIEAERGHVGRFIAFAKMRGRPLETLTIKDVTSPSLVFAFMRFLRKRTGLRGSYQARVVETALILATHQRERLQLTDPNRAFWDMRVKQLAELGRRVKRNMKKRKNMSLLVLPLADLEKVPDQIARLRFERTAKLAKLGKDFKKDKKYATYLRDELIIRFEIERPFRNRNLREMCLGKHLRKISQSSAWEIHFSADEMKGGKEHTATFPACLVGLLNEYLEWARPLLLNKRISDCLFVNRWGNPIRSDKMTRLFQNWTKKVLGKRLWPHLFRHAVATDYLTRRRNDYIGAQMLLQHARLETTLKTYTHLRTKEAYSDYDDYRRSQSKEESEPTRSNGTVGGRPAGSSSTAGASPQPKNVETINGHQPTNDRKRVRAS